MHAMVYDGYGDASVLYPSNLPIPKRLPGQVLIEVWASSVNPVDYRIRRGELKGLLQKSGRIMLAHPNADDLRKLIELYEKGELQVTIDSRFPMSEVAQAHRRVEQGVDRGKVVLLSDRYQPS